MQSKELKIGLLIDLGKRSFSEHEIISYANQFDPLFFHTDPVEAKKSIFKGLVASGSQVFKVMYAENWVPLFGKSVAAGLAVNNWNFMLPIFPDKLIRAEAEIKSLLKTTKDNEVIVKWKFTFYNPQNQLAQSLEIKILHNKELI